MKYLKISGIIIAAALMTVLIILGSQNKQDPLWNNLDELIKKDNIVLIQDRIDLLKNIFHSIQRDNSIKKMPPLALISKPFLPLWDHKKFIKYLELTIKSRFIIFSGVTGSG